MYIQEIHIKSFRHLEEIHLGPFTLPPNGSDLIVLAGPNGSGKSSILELLSYALSNTWSLSWSLRRSFPTNAFEIGLAVTPDERKLIQEYIASSQRATTPEVQTYFENNSVYYRSYNYPEGKYSKQANIHDQIHNLVSQALRNEYSRALGFFLKSDRYYPPEGFRRDQLFNYQQIIQRDYIWNMAFNTSDIQYRDMFEFLVQQRYHYDRNLGAYYRQNNTRGIVTGEPPTDPLLPYDQLLQKLFPGYKFAEPNEEIPTNLFIQIPGDIVVPFQDLSSGEKEVFFILSFFLRHNVTNAMIVIDEPELHLHPELARLLIRTMQSIKSGNQVWLATHNPEIIDEAGRDHVIYVSRDTKSFKSQLTNGANEPEAIRIMKDMFGFSGYIGISKRMVFLEGENSSSDRKMFSNAFPEYGNIIKFIPANSSENLTRINAAILSILESNLGWAEFFLLRDRDFLSQEAINKYNEHSSGRVYVFKRHEIENYLLDEELIAKVETEIFNRPVKPDHVRIQLRNIARNISGEVLRDMIAFRLNLLYRPEDFSLGKLLDGQPIIDLKGAYIEDKVSVLNSHLTTKVSQVNANLSTATDPSALNAYVEEYKEEIRSAVTGDGDNWKFLFPGKRLLEEYAKLEGLGNPLILQNSLIKEMSYATDHIPEELLSIIKKIALGEKLSS